MKLLRSISLFVLTNLAVLLMGGLTVLALGYFGIDVLALLRVRDMGGLAIYAAIFGFAGALFSLAISRWVAKTSHGVVLIAPEDVPRLGAKERLVWDTVERISRGHGINMPQVGVYPSPEPNAFATGPTANRALVAVSSGLLETMNADEIEGVVAHEMAHVLNGDMVTMTLVQGVMNAFVIFFAQMIAWTVSKALSQMNRHPEEEQASSSEPAPQDPVSQLVGFVVRFVLEISLGILASVVVMAFSRWREYRADEGGARYAGRDKMIAGLRRLKKIVEREGEPSGQSAPSAMGVSGKQGGLLSLWASHPPLEERIARLEKGYFVR